MSLLSPFPLILLFFALLSSTLSLGHESESFGSCPFGSSHGSHHSDDHDHHNHDHDHHHHFHGQGKGLSRPKLPEELAEEDDLELSAFGSPHRHVSSHDHGDHQLTKLGLWIHAMGCSLLVSMCSLICLIILPVVLLQGKPSKTLVDSLAAFGAGAMLGDSFLHQLPHAFGGGHLHSHDHHLDHSHGEAHHHGHSQSHSHSLEDLSVGLSILSGIVLFLLVEKVVRYVEDLSGKGAHAWGHGHHHHFHHKSGKKLQDDDRSCDEPNALLVKTKNRNNLDAVPDDSLNDDKHSQEIFFRKRSTSAGTADDNKDAANGSITKTTPATEEEPDSSPSNKVFGYLNLFSDGVHNFTDGMALGSAFLLYGSVGGWSRTLFLIAHELPQEVGDFGILVRSGFSASKALFFNFLSALVALAGTALVSARLLMRPALALILGQDPGQSSLIEGFTAGGFIYIAVAGVLPEMNGGNSTFKSSAIQLTSLISGMAVALCISLLE